MSDPSGKGLSGKLIAEQTEVTLDEVSGFCRVRREEVVALVHEGILEPRDLRAEEWLFPGWCLRRAARALRLRQDFEIDLPAVALVLDLLEEVERLRTQVEATRDERSVEQAAPAPDRER